METPAQNTTQNQSQTPTLIPNPEPIIKITDLNITYNRGKTSEVRALENVNLEIYPREYVIIFGPSGCGKSTLLYSIAGLQKPTSGTVETDGENIDHYSDSEMVFYHRRKIGLIFQAFYLIESLNVVDNIFLPKAFTDEDEKAAQTRVLQLMERFGIADQAKKFPSQLSGGQKQRASIARALINNPEIILADEPVGNLDSKSSHNVMAILDELNRHDQKTVILVTHDPAHLVYGDKIVHMKDGKITKIEVVKNRKSPLDSYIFKKGQEGALKEDLRRSGLEREEYIPADLRQLSRSFQSFSPERLGEILVSFKAEQIFSHIFFSITNEQITAAKNDLADILYGKIDYAKMEKILAAPEEEHGAGWDKRNAEKFTREAKRLIEAGDRIDFTEVSHSAEELGAYLRQRYELELDEKKTRHLAELISDRLKNRVGMNEFNRICDLPEKEGGLGLDRRTSRKVAHELELLLLIRYSK